MVMERQTLFMRSDAVSHCPCLLPQFMVPLVVSTKGTTVFAIVAIRPTV